ncbi:hypothetical protein [Aestuariirhabdus litorea]|uniref:Uncharacterized protein n=1 Tax=Aestuariirhabdus litorea TaxID=2528527 RepID=A0A3P3VRC2_9GAMM|nr:hypothetical protein [Aestuariirhabdus litorea]RRJ85331.1 hypothetical protein D0544_09800 [Aestuariirhabdus litorea]RWW98553.1 hypothetical protein DZC74_09785 [Endozoicomonadaceae bacterium GTF-13]
MSKLDKEQVLAEFTAAYTKANGKAPEIDQKGSWYSVDGGKSVRLADLAEMTTELSGAPAKAEPAPKKAAAPKKAPAAKAKAKPATTGGGLTPKQLWKQKLSGRDTLPRGVN